MADCFHMEDRFQPVAGFCVASVKQAGSILLFSTVPIMELDGATIGITDEASSAPQLLQVLLRLKYGVRPKHLSLSMLLTMPFSSSAIKPCANALVRQASATSTT